MFLAAIDFGSTFSGYAYSILNDYDEDPLKITTTQKWKSMDGKITAKTPTAILFQPDKTFHSFGYQAISNYSELLLETDEEDLRSWYFFQNFKMLLYNEPVSGNHYTTSYVVIVKAVLR